MAEDRADRLSDPLDRVAYSLMQGSIEVVEYKDRQAEPDWRTVDQVTQAATRYLAAQVIANPEFPRRNLLPRPRPLAFTNFGHWPMVDYQRLVNIVWQVAMDASHAAARHWRSWYVFALCGVAAAIGLVLFALHAAIETIFVALAPVIIAIAIFLHYRIKAARNAVASVRANALEGLANDSFEERPPLVDVWTQQIGTGELGSTRVPVLTMVNAKPSFPGFGAPRIEKLFVCRPKPDADQVAVAELSPRVRAQIIAKMREQSQVGSCDGEVVVVDGETLSMESPWLGPNMAPRLWLSRAELPQVHDIDPRVSVRVFHACQVVAARYATTATFFFRVFPAGNAVAFQIAVATLGPPMFGLRDIAARVLKYRVERVRRSWFAEALPSVRTPIEGDDLAILRPVDAANQELPRFQGEFKLAELVQLDPKAEAMRDPYGAPEQLATRIAGESSAWPGRLLLQPGNLREQRSHWMTNDFFGHQEALALVRTIYDQVTRGVLETFDQSGYDISDYRDRDGRFTIHADQIDQLVVGEQVNISQGDKSGGKPSQAATGTSQAQGSPT